MDCNLDLTTSLPSATAAPTLREMPPTPRPSVLIRFSGEIGVKGRKTRDRFCRRLAENLAEALARGGVEHTIQRRWSRLVVTVDDAERALDVAATVFGVRSASAIVERPWTRLEDLVTAGEELMATAVDGRRFRVRARRTGATQTIPFDSVDVERALGDALRLAGGRVDLETPEVTVAVEVHRDRAFFYDARREGPGGLPLGVEGRALSLISGGFDSAVASWAMMRRGLSLDYLFFNLGGRVHEIGTLRVLTKLWRRWGHGDRPRFVTIDLRPVVEQMSESVRPFYWQVLLKRLMVRAAGRVAADLGLKALVTGECLGQVSSQTLANLAAIDRASSLPILRPLIGADKENIVQRARDIGVFDEAAAVREYCALSPRRTATAAREESLAAEEARLEGDLFARTITGARLRNLGEIHDRDLVTGELELDEIPPGVTALDLRPKPQFQAWHPPRRAPPTLGSGARSVALVRPPEHLRAVLRGRSPERGPGGPDAGRGLRGVQPAGRRPRPQGPPPVSGSAI